MPPTPRPAENPPTAASPNCSSKYDDTTQETGPRKRKRRAQYALRACDNCRNRKVKCCGKLPCKRCVDRSETCAYQLSERLDGYQIGSGGEMQHSETTAELQRRVGELELELERLKIQAESMAQESEVTKSTGLPFSEEPDTFRLENGALHSKFQALLDVIPDYALSQSHLLPHFDDTPEREPTKSKMLLPAPKTLHKLLDLFFNSMNRYYPCVDRPVFEERLLQILRKSKYPNALEVHFCSLDVSFMALVAIAIAQAQHFEQERSKTSHATIDWEYYHQSCSLIRNLQRKGQELDLIRAHTLCSMYLVQKERLSDACQQIVTAIVIAQAYGLNNQSSWPIDLTPTEQIARKCLFYTIYYQDRRVAEKLGKPYFLRDSEVGVDDFSSNDVADYCNLAYFQKTVEWARLWGEVWDVFFAMRARKAFGGNAEALSSMDLRVQQISQSLPPDLVFSPRDVASYSSSGDLRARCRLLIYIRWQLLRLILQQNQLVGVPTNVDALVLVLDLASETIIGICNYISVFPDSQSQIGVAVTAALVDCICHIVPPIFKLHRSTGMEEATSRGIHALRSAKDGLLSMAENSGAAARATKIIQPIFSAMENVSSGFKSDLSGQPLEPNWNDLQGSSGDSVNVWDIGGLEGLGGVFVPDLDISQEHWMDFGEPSFDINPVLL